MVARVNRMVVLAPQREWSARQRLQLLLSAGTLQISLVLCEQTSAEKGGGMSPAFVAANDPAYVMRALHYGPSTFPLHCSLFILSCSTMKSKVEDAQIRLHAET